MTELYSQILYLHLRNKNIKSVVTEILNHPLCTMYVYDQRAGEHANYQESTHFYKFFVRL